MKTKAVLLGLLICTGFISAKSFGEANDKYWKDLEKLCLKYSTAAHPPCNRSNGAKMIVEHIEYMCNDNKACMKDSVKMCTQYSTATHPPCHSNNGLNMVLSEVKRSAQFYPLNTAAIPKVKEPKSKE